MLEQVLANPQVVNYTSVIISMIVGLIVKDWATNFVSGLMFFLDKNFQEGQMVLLDGQPAIIVKIGLRMTVFGLSSTRGYTWRFVPNTKINDLHLEKIVVNREIQALPDMQRRIEDLENFLESANEDFRRQIQERERRMEERERDALEKQIAAGGSN